jgi:hypothetical protein
MTTLPFPSPSTPHPDLDMSDSVATVTSSALFWNQPKPTKGSFSLLWGQPPLTSTTQMKPSDAMLKATSPLGGKSATLRLHYHQYLFQKSLRLRGRSISDGPAHLVCFAVFCRNHNAS